MRRLIESLLAQQVNFPFEIIVISNPPSLYAVELLKQTGNVIHLQTEVLGVNNARNLGVKKATGEILLFLDSDCELSEPNFLQRHSDLHISYPELSCVGGIYSYSGDAARDLTYNYIQTRWLLQGQVGDYNRYLIGGNFSCKKEALLGDSFDPRIAYGGSETEFFLRMLVKSNLKYKLFLDLEVLHNTDLGIIEFCKKAFKQGFGARYLRQKLNQEAEASSAQKDLVRFEELNYKKEMEFWLVLYDASYNQGYHSKNGYHVLKVLGILVLTYFNFYRIKASDFFGSLENLLRNLPRK
ncbi:MAG: glycosyltransferase [Bdellovibrio sp.]|nr:glycosyltransferase [Bdellovibrio sp.]